jgi:D-alanyl-D-alanine carboxypeptidase
MLRISRRAARGLRWGVFGLATVLAFTAVTAEPADAKARRKKVKQYAKAAAYNPPQAAIVIDGNTGAVLHAANADSLRHPASLTKIMTLYLLFERLDGGRLKLETPLAVSARAADQAPSKLGLKPGQTIAVESAIKALVTKSANDVAVVVAEALAGSEDEFATLMTRKARTLGMSRTVYRNASGLPDDDQVTTAREQALLGRAIQERFPRYYRYFATSSFAYGGQTMRNHNKLLGRVEGVDGIKTGYIRASGFNLVTSVRRGGRHIVAVVLGGRSASVRDAKMRSLIGEYVAVASATKRGVPIAEQDDTAAVAARASGKPAKTARADHAPTAAIAEPHPANPSDPIRPILVKTISVKSSSVSNAALSPLPSARGPVATPPIAAPQPPARAAVQPAPAAAVAPAPAAPAPNASGPVEIVALPMPPLPAASTKSEPRNSGPEPVKPISVASAQPAELPRIAVPRSDPRTVSPRPEPIKAVTVASAQPVELPRTAAAEPALESKHIARGGWLIQVGAFEAESEARERLSEAQSRMKGMLGRADPFTERVVKGDKQLYRARFAGFDKDSAEAACRALKRNDIACISLKN